MDKKQLALKNIAIFVSTGFFLGDDTYWVGQKHINNHGLQDYKWYYNPKEVYFNVVIDEFSARLKEISEDLLKYKRIILPLSGGLDSRSQAALLADYTNIKTFSYSFRNGIDENAYGKKISELRNFEFRDFSIPPGYLWGKIEKLADWNNCESEFTHPRQMAIEEEFSNMGDVFFLGHWGDVLFDSMEIDENAGGDELIAALKRKIIKKRGMELGETLWEVWDFPGSFDQYLDSELDQYLSQINIDHAGARIRAFKSLHWLPRWTLCNLCVFEKYHPIVLPYCDTRMFDFVCTVPEEYLAGRKIQIEYIKRQAPELAKIPWQPYAPQNLYNYRESKSIKYWSKKGWEKVKSEYNRRIKSKKLIQRNWELQFLGKENDDKLRSWLFENPKFSQWVPREIVKKYYDLFRNKDEISYSHSVSMLLTLSVFSKKFL